MKKVKFLKHHNHHVEGDVIEVTDLRFNYFIRTGVAAEYKEPVKEKKETTAPEKKEKKVASKNNIEKP